MNLKFYPLRAMLLTLLLFGFKAQAQVALDFVKSVDNISTGLSGTVAKVNQILQYTITVRNLTSSNYVASKLYDNIPAGTSYITGSTTLNGIAVADGAGGKMPYAGGGGYIKSPGIGVGAGILLPGVTATIIFQVKVTANGGTVFNNATIDATQGSVSTIQATNTVYTNITVDAACNVVYEITPSTTNPSSPSYNYIRSVDMATGQAATTYFNGTSGTQRDQWTRNTISRTGPSGINILSGSAALAYDRDRQWLFFCNNAVNEPLCYVDLSTGAPYTAYRFTGYPLETNTSGGYYVNRLGMGSDGNLYGVASNAMDLVKVSFKDSAGYPTPVITHLGPLAAAATNDGHDVFTDGGGDVFADGNGKLYLIANSGNMYKINPSVAPPTATYMGSVTPFTPGATACLAIDANGVVYIGGTYQYKYTLDLQTMATTQINTATSGVYVASDFATCGFPVLTSSIIADKSYKNINGSTTVNGGDTIVYTIKVTNIGNINAAGVYMYDYIPPATIYRTHTTRVNGTLIADASGGVMPYSVSGGKLVMTNGESPGIVKPGIPNAAIVTFEVITLPNVQVCNQSRIQLLDADGNVMFVNSNDPTNVGQTPTCFYSDGVLPLSNLNFKGSLNEDRSVLNWSMNGDENVATYEVEFSESGTAFTTTGRVAGKGNTNSANSYQFIDNEHTFASIRYYRLKAIQKGGNYTYSGIIKLNAKEQDVEVAPNPFDKDINVQIRLKTAETVRIRLVDLLGKVVYNTTEQLSIGSHSLSIRIPAGLVKGMYILDIKSGSEQIFQKKLLKK